jgi:sugar/nucleoside kinase (ribokinase family)
MTALDLFSIGSWTLFDHILRAPHVPHDGETLALDMPPAELGRLHFGDCSANVAAAASRLGRRVGLGMVVGDDFVSSGYQDHLTALGVDLTGVEVRSGVRSGQSYNVFDRENHGFCLSHLGVAATQDHWTPPLAQIAEARAVVVNEMFSPYTLGAIELARDQGSTTAINGMVASAGELTEHFLAAANLLFLSRAEAGDLQAALGVSSAADILVHGPELVVVTQGSAGSLWHTADGTVHVPAAQAERVVDTTGAGDAFVAGALCGLLAGLEPEESGRCAAVLASFVAEAWGCQTNLPGLAKLRHRYREQFGRECPL